MKKRKVTHFVNGLLNRNEKIVHLQVSKAEKGSIFIELIYSNSDSRNKVDSDINCIYLSVSKKLIFGYFEVRHSMQDSLKFQAKNNMNLSRFIII